MEERGSLSWKNAEKEAAADADDSESLVSGAEAESVEYVEEYEEEIVSEEEYEDEEFFEEVSMQSEEQDKQPEAVEQDAFFDKVEPPADAVEAMPTEQIKEAAPSVHEEEETISEPVEHVVAVVVESLQDAAAVFSHNSAEWTSFESQPTGAEWTSFESQPTGSWGEAARDGEPSEAIERETIAEDNLASKLVEAAPAAELSSTHEDAQVEIVSPKGEAHAEVAESLIVARPVGTEQREVQKPVLSPRKPQSSDGNDKNIGWAKPDWATTSPLKNKKTSVNSTISSPEKSIGWEKPVWTNTKLRPLGKDLKKGVDLQSPITHIQKIRMDDINFEANPIVLKPSSKGTDVRLGENLAKPITHCAKNPMAGVNVVAIPDCILKPTDIGVKLKQSGDLQGPITHVAKDNHTDDINFEANPLILKPTDKGAAVRLGENLARPITFISGNKPSEETL